MTLSTFEAVEARRVPGEDLVALCRWHAGEARLNGLPRVRPIGADVGIVTRPHHAVDADLTAVTNSKGVGHVGEVDVALDIDAGLDADGEVARLPQAVVVVVDLFLEVRNPSAV